MAEEQDQSRQALDHKSQDQCDVKLNKAVGKGPHEYTSEGIVMETDPIDHPGASSSLNSRGNEQLHSLQRKHGHGSPPTRDYYHITQKGISADAQIGVLSGAHPHETHITSNEDGFSMDKNRKTDEARSRMQESSKRREKLLQKESLKNAKKEGKKELPREKELVKQRVVAERRAKHKSAKEPIELIEDEELELMELAAQKKGLPAITSLDHDTLQNLELFREFLVQFPPESVQLKRPFAIKPWIDSDENIGNLLMVWRFCMTFADAMVICPFTLDELVQAFHETDSTLLGEIHISLLKLVINDMESVSRTSSVSVGAKQFTATNPAHPHVNGAYKWGFDIDDWKKQLGPMSWPGILRQFALSAGFGPKLREKDVGKNYVPDEETKGSEDVVASLRNGVAAQKAFEQMRRKSVPSQKKSRPRLTPGTLKYAAYSVLSLEGSEGLTVKKLAHKIQECGLRDLSTRKYPETSISVVLSTDTVHFQRTAPSTYRVKTRFRKDPVDADSILSAAGMEKINLNENEFSLEGNAPDEENEVLKVDDTPDMEKDRGSEKDNPEEDCTGIAESQLGAPWLQGLIGGEYADLPIQNQLDALVALIDIVNQGTSMKAIVKDRFDNATTLKRNMWAQVQLEQKRIKEHFISKSHHVSSMGDDEMKQENMSTIPQDWICHNLHGHTAKEARLCIDHKAEEIYPYRALPLGQDRRLNRYWRFGASSSVNDPNSGRIFVESPTGQWRVFDSKEAFDALCTSLDKRGIKESELQFMLREIEKSFKDNIKRNKN